MDKETVSTDVSLNSFYSVYLYLWEFGTDIMHLWKLLIIKWESLFSLNLFLIYLHVYPQSSLDPCTFSLDPPPSTEASSSTDRQGTLCRSSWDQRWESCCWSAYVVSLGPWSVPTPCWWVVIIGTALSDSTTCISNPRILQKLSKIELHLY